MVTVEPESTCIEVRGGRQKNKQCHPESENDDDNGVGGPLEMVVMVVMIRRMPKEQAMSSIRNPLIP